MRATAATIAVLAAGAFGFGSFGSGGAPLGPETAKATDGKHCGIIVRGRNDFLVRAKRLKCSRARKGARRYLRTGTSLRGFRCNRNLPPWKFVCGKSTRRGERIYRAKKL